MMTNTNHLSIEQINGHYTWEITVSADDNSEAALQRALDVVIETDAQLRVEYGSSKVTDVEVGPFDDDDVVGQQEATEQVDALRVDIEARLLGAAGESRYPLSREQLMDRVRGRRQAKRIALAELLHRGRLVEVAVHAPRSRSRCVWTYEQALAANLLLPR